MTQQYDLVVIGTGTGASVAADRCRAAGWRVAVIDHLPFGGTCALRGCDPKKVLVGAAEAIDHVRRMRLHGVAGGEPAIAWDELMRFKRSFTEPVPAIKQESFAKKGIDTYHGRAKFCGPRSVEVEGRVLEGRFVLIAVGAVPMRLGMAGEEHIVTSTEFLELERLPKRIVLLGGGFIAAEFANIAAQARAQVTVIEQMDRMLAPFDPDLVGWLMEKFHDIGIAPPKGRRASLQHDARRSAVLAVAAGGYVRRPQRSAAPRQRLLLPAPNMRYRLIGAGGGFRGDQPVYRGTRPSPTSSKKSETATAVARDRQASTGTSFEMSDCSRTPRTRADDPSATFAAEERQP